MNFCHLFPLGEINSEYLGPNKPKMHSVHVKNIWKSFVGEAQMSLLEKRCVFLSCLVEI